MPSTVNKRCVVYILAKQVRSQTVSFKFLWMIIMILQLMKSLYAHDVIDDLPLSVFSRL